MRAPALPALVEETATRGWSGVLTPAERGATGPGVADRCRVSDVQRRILSDRVLRRA